MIGKETIEKLSRIGSRTTIRQERQVERRVATIAQSEINKKYYPRSDKESAIIKKIDGKESHGIVGLSMTKDSVIKGNFTTKIPESLNTKNGVIKDGMVSLKQIGDAIDYDIPKEAFEGKKLANLGFHLKEVKKETMLYSIHETFRHDFPNHEPVVVDLLRKYHENVTEANDLMVVVQVYDKEGNAKNVERSFKSLIDPEVLDVYNGDHELERFKENFGLKELEKEEIGVEWFGPEENF